MRHAAMNKFYRIVWNVASQSWQAVSESARGKGKSSRSKSDGNSLINKAAILISSLLILPTAMAEPTGGNVTAGQGSIQQSGPNTTITQKSPRLAIDWNTFSINAQESVNFIQPDVSSIALNRVTGAESSGILGSLTANGQVWILNPNGVLFGNSAQVNVGGLVASTLSLSNDDFMLGKYNFSGTGGTVENRGIIKVPAGGIVALLAPVVKNNGSIMATQGNVLLAATEAVTLQPEGSSLSYTINRGAFNALAENGGLIQADGGRIVLTAAARDSLTKSVTNNTGLIEANTVHNKNGTILLLGDMQHGTVNVAGKLSAAAPNGGDGGFIETSAATVKVADGASISTSAQRGKTGHWLVDPTDFTIAATGGDITGTQLGTNLGLNNVTIQTTLGGAGSSGDVNVNDTVSWSANKLTLNAQNNININSTMNGSVSAQLALEYGQGAIAAGNTSDYYVNAPVNLSAGNNFSTKLGADGTNLQYTVITELGAPGSTTGTDLQGIQGNLTVNYVLGSNIDASATGSGGLWGTVGFNPLINAHKFDGLGHAINSLTINRPQQFNVGLFGSSSGEIRNLGLVNFAVSGVRGNMGSETEYLDATGGLAGRNGGKISNSYATGSVFGLYNVGGLVGENKGTISNSNASGSVGGSYSVGGLVGTNNYGGTVINSFAEIIVSGNSSTGGLVGTNQGGIVTNSNADVRVSGNSYTGGLVGANSGTLSNSYVKGSIRGSTQTGGLVGYGNFLNSFYDIGQVTINNQYLLSPGGIYFDQFQNWLTNAKTLNILNYSSLPLSTEGYYMVSNIQGLKDLLGFANNGYNFKLASDINLASTPGFYIPTFKGVFDGANHVISNLSINAPGYDRIGLFGQLSGTVKNVGVVNVDVSGQNYVGGLVGYNTGTLLNSNASGNVSGNSLIGGLVGYNPGTLSSSYFTGNVSGNSLIGGLVGYNSGTMFNSYTSGSVSGNNYTGGLVGYNVYGTLSNSYATSSVSGSSQTGGLVGFNYAGTLSNSYASGSVRGNTYTGGLVGVNGGTVNNSYAKGSVSGSNYTGGLVGEYYGNTLRGCDCSVPFTVVNASFWDTEKSGQGTSAGGIGLTTAQMKTEANFNSATTVNGNINPNWDFTNVWKIYDGNTYPLLKALLTPITLDIAAKDVVKIYDKIAFHISTDDVTYSVTDAVLSGTLTNIGNSEGAVNAGSYSIIPGGLYSNQYDITYINGTLTVNKASLGTSLVADSKVYDGNDIATISNATLTGLITGDSVDSSIATASFDTKNVGTAKTVTASIGLTGTDAGNYSVARTATTQADITAKAVTLVSVTADNKIYDGNTTANISAKNISGLIHKDAVGATVANANFDTKNVGTGKTVSVNGIALIGADAGNYLLNTSTATTLADITPKALTISGFTSANKVYDQTTSATITNQGTLTGIVAGESVSFTNTTATFSDRNAGLNKTVTLNGVVLSGIDSGNYIYNGFTTDLSDITPKLVKISGFSVFDKKYDGTTLAIIKNVGTLSGIITGDFLGFNYTNATFANALVGRNKTVTLNGVGLNGADALNYIYVAPTTTKANIRP